MNKKKRIKIFTETWSFVQPQQLFVVMFYVMFQGTLKLILQLSVKQYHKEEQVDVSKYESIMKNKFIFNRYLKKM